MVFFTDVALLEGVFSSLLTMVVWGGGGCMRKVQGV